jgi:tetratricopeptide (TPR) repeat protein
MKKNAKPELTGGWWRTNQPHGLSSAKALEDALKAYEAALKLLEKSGSVNHHLACVKTIDALRQAAKKAQDDAEKMLKSPPKDAKFDSQDVENTVSALKKLPGMLDEAREEADDLKEEDEGLFGNAEKYQLYLKKWLKKARSAPLTFAFVAGATSAEHRIMLHRSKDPTALLTKLKTETKLKKGTFGMAGAHPEDNTTLVLELYTKPLPGLSKKFRLLLKRFKPLPFNRVLVTMEGNAVTEVPDPEDTEPEEDESIEQGAAAVQPQDSITAPAASSTPARQTAIAGSAAALATWQAARASVVDQLKTLGTSIAATRDAEAKHAVIMLQAIIKNLTPEPGTEQSVLELERYLTTDDIIVDVESPNPFGVQISVRQPLLDALAPLKAELVA